MRKKRWRLLVLFSLAFIAGAVLVIPTSRLCFWGWLRGEVCYKGRPVSYWRWVLDGWRVEKGASDGYGQEIIEVVEVPGTADKPAEVITTETSSMVGGIYPPDPPCDYVSITVRTVIKSDSTGQITSLRPEVWYLRNKPKYLDELIGKLKGQSQKDAAGSQLLSEVLQAGEENDPVPLLMALMHDTNPQMRKVAMFGLIRWLSETNTPPKEDVVAAFHLAATDEDSQIAELAQEGLFVVDAEEIKRKQKFTPPLPTPLKPSDRK